MIPTEIVNSNIVVFNMLQEITVISALSLDHITSIPGDRLANIIPRSLICNKDKNNSLISKALQSRGAIIEVVSLILIQYNIVENIIVYYSLIIIVWFVYLAIAV